MSESTSPLLLIGRVLVDRGMISEEVLEKALLYQAGHRALNWPGKRLGEHLVLANLVDRKTVIELLKERDATAADTRWAGLGELAVKNGFLTREQLQHILAHQRYGLLEGIGPRRLGPIMRERRVVGEQQLQAIIDRQKVLYSAMNYTPDVKRRPGTYPFKRGTRLAFSFGF